MSQIYMSTNYVLSSIFFSSLLHLALVSLSVSRSIYTLYQKMIWTLSMLTLWRRFHDHRKIFFKHPIHHSIALKLYFIVRVKIFIKKRSLVGFLGFFVKPLIFCAKNLFGHFHYFLSTT